jgi:hypothetical protein
MTIPTYSRECAIHAEDWTSVLGVTPADVQALWSQAVDSFGEDTLRSLHARTHLELPLEVFVGADRTGVRVLTLWLGPTRLARQSREVTR